MLLADRVAGNGLGNASKVKPFISKYFVHIDVQTGKDDIDNESYDVYDISVTFVKLMIMWSILMHRVSLMLSTKMAMLILSIISIMISMRFIVIYILEAYANLHNTQWDLCDMAMPMYMWKLQFQ